MKYKRSKNMNKYLAHLKTINRHRRIVRQWCFRMGIPWQGLIHDLSKYSIVEFWTSARYFQGNGSPIDKEKSAKGYSEAWLHHFHNNKHHPEYWMDTKNGGVPYAIKMPFDYLVEMLCDYIGAGQTYEKTRWTLGSPLAYWEKNKHRFIPCMHEKSVEMFESMLKTLSMATSVKSFVATWKYSRKQVKAVYNKE